MKTVLNVGEYVNVSCSLTVCAVQVGYVRTLPVPSVRRIDVWFLAA